MVINREAQGGAASSRTDETPDVRSAYTQGSNLKDTTTRSVKRLALFAISLALAAVLFVAFRATRPFDPSFILGSPTASGGSVDPPRTLLRALTLHEFAWAESTTPIPISTASVWLKLLLSGGEGVPGDLLQLVPAADTIPVRSVRAWLNRKRFERVIKDMCETGLSTFSCDPSEREEVYGLTPLHIAAASSDYRLYEWLVEHGADPDVEDGVGRKPSNLTYDTFISNSKKWARKAGRYHCDLPEVVFEDGASKDDIERAKLEARRLISEGEPVFMRGALSYFAPKLVNDWKVEDFVRDHAEAEVQVGSVPYAPAFNLSSTAMSLRDYYDRFVKTSSELPLYVFHKEPSVNVVGYKSIVSMLRHVAPIPSLLADPDAAGGLDGIHFFLGRANSGAPHHIHADALNVVISGSKRWFIYTPASTIYSRKHIKKWLDEDYVNLAEEDRPLECVQKPGDVIYVPLDWGHAVINQDENTFGYALELLNKRDTFLGYDRLGLHPHEEL
jgi:hypothetical protein